MASNGSQAIVAAGEVKSSLPAPQLDVLDTQTKAVGVIIPPHNIRQVVDKTADFVAQNGTDFEQKILAGPKNVKFNFLHPTDPYHKYYQYKIVESKEGTPAAQAAFAADGAAALTAATPDAAPATARAENVQPPPTQELKKPNDEKYTAHVPPGLTLPELEIIKLTAQYVARNGAEFLSGLRSREDSKREFMFLKETHSLNTFFKRLTDAYSSVLLDSREALKQLHADAMDSSAILQRCLQRLEWVRVKESEADEAKAEKERERIAMMLIDWHDFSVVRTIEFDDSEDVMALGKPVTKEMVIQMNKTGDLPEEAEEAGKAMDAEDTAAHVTTLLPVEADEEEAALIAAGQTATPWPPLPAAPESAAGSVMMAADDGDAPIKVVKDYKRTATGQEYDPTKYVVSPITGELVPLAEMQEHMRINLIDPKWKDQREAMLAKIKETTKASDTELMANLTRLAGTRPDVFGSDVRELGGVLAGGPGPIPRDGPTQLPKPTAKGGKPTLAPLPAAPAGVSMNRSMHQPPGPAPPAGAPPGIPGTMPPPPLPSGGLPPVPPAGAPPGPPPMGAPPPQKRPMPPSAPDPKKPKTS